VTIEVPAPVAPGIPRRLAVLPYEGLMLLALVLIASFPAAGLRGAALSGWPHLLFQAYLFCLTATYFTWFWRHGGQTLPMKTWGIQMVDHHGRPLHFSRAFLRFFAALMMYGPACAALVMLFFPARISPYITVWGFLPMIATLLWARFDSDHQFLHDRLAGTRLIDARLGKPR
jgi:uncharacterized RDD family membrane protein YckC